MMPSLEWNLQSSKRMYDSIIGSIYSAPTYCALGSVGTGEKEGPFADAAKEEKTQVNFSNLQYANVEFLNSF